MVDKSKVMLGLVALVFPMLSSAACSTRNVSVNTLIEASQGVRTAAKAVRQATASAKNDLGTTLHMSAASREIVTESTWLVALLNLRSDMRDALDKEAVEDLYDERANALVVEISEAIKYINELSGGIQSAGVAAQVPVLTRQLASLQKVLNSCKK